MLSFEYLTTVLSQIAAVNNTNWLRKQVRRVLLKPVSYKDS